MTGTPVAISRAELLRRLTPGTRLTLVYRSSDGPKNLWREVISSTKYSVLMKGPDLRSRVSLARAQIFETPNGFELRWPEDTLRYEWREDEPDAISPISPPIPPWRRYVSRDTKQLAFPRED